MFHVSSGQRTSYVRSKSSSSKSSVRKCWYTAVFAVLIISTVIAHPQRRHVHQFRTATWNSNGGNWDSVSQYMCVGLDLIAVQEARSLRDIRNQLETPVASTAAPPICLSQFLIEEVSYLGITEYLWQPRGNTFYLYHVDRNTADPNNPNVTPSPTPPVPEHVNVSRAQNLAIVSRYRAEEIVILPSEARASSANRLERNVNQPVFGIRIAQSLFFSIHPEQTRGRNDASILVESVLRNVRNDYPDISWMLMGDFNRSPEQLEPLPEASAGHFREIVRSRAHTTGSGELDYAVVGGPDYLRNQILTIGAIVLAGEERDQATNPSDHAPVGFYVEKPLERRC